MQRVYSQFAGSPASVVTSTQVAISGAYLCKRILVFPRYRGRNGVRPSFLHGEDAAKKAKARALLADHPTISTQVINEFLNVCRVKLDIDVVTRHRLAMEIMAGCDVVHENTAVVEKAMVIEARSTT